MLTITTLLSFLLLVGGGATMPYDTNIAIGLYISSPIPLLVRKIVDYINSSPQESKIPPLSAEDPVAPTPDEPSAV